MAAARRAMEAAGVACAHVPAATFRGAVEHRRVLWAHSRSRNSSLAVQLCWACVGVGALHSLTSDCIEFREASSGRLVAFSLLTAHGAYAAAPLYACCPEYAKAGIWCARAALQLAFAVLLSPIPPAAAQPTG